MAELLEIIADMALEKVVPKGTSAAEAKLVPCISRYIPAQVKRDVYLRDNGECQYVDPITKRKCLSRFKIQYEHIVPFASGGKTSAKNLTLYCATHNQLAALNFFGPEKMNKYLSISHVYKPKMP
jgi:hypothetical protein